MRETEGFINEGRGWECKRCRAEGGGAAEGVGRPDDEAREEAAPSSDTLPRYFREGEAEEREPRLAARTLARWRDETRRALVCPRCGAEEILEK